MSKETNRKVIDTTPVEHDLPAFVRIVCYERDGQPETKLMLQRYLLTKIDTVINRDEALALTQALTEHFQFMPREIATGLPAMLKGAADTSHSDTIILVRGPKGCGKTRYADALRAHYGANAVVEDGSDLGVYLSRLAPARARTILILTNREGSDLEKLKKSLGRVEIVQIEFEDAIRGARTYCAHSWSRQLCPDIHQPDYCVCSKCGATKEL